MQSTLPASRKAVLDALMAAGEPQSLDDLHAAGVAGLSRSALLRQLQGMVEDGLVERRGERKSALYLPQEQMQFGWNVSLGGYWRRLEWTAEPPLDLRYPLASRIPDIPARLALFRFLEEVQRRNLDRPWQFLDKEFQDRAFEEQLDGLSEEGRREFRRWIRNPSTHGDITFIVFGSCARGTARHDSDLDLIVVTPYSGSGGGNVRTIEFKEVRLPSPGYETMLEEIAFDLEVGVPRPIDLKVVEQDDLVSLPPGLLQTIAREGVTVHATRPSSDWAETWQEQLKEMETKHHA